MCTAIDSPPPPFRSGIAHSLLTRVFFVLTRIFNQPNDGHAFPPSMFCFPFHPNQKHNSGWETAMIDEMTPRFEQEAGSGYGEGETFADIDLDFFTKKSGDDIIENGNQPEPYLIIIAYLGMVIFAAVSMGAWNFSEPKSVALYSRVLLSLGGMFVVALSTVACLGFISAIGIKLTPLSVSVVPFLSLGIGIDDMFIFIYTLVHTTDSARDPRRRIETTLVHAGPSVGGVAGDVSHTVSPITVGIL